MDRLSINNDDMPVILPDDGTVEQYDPRSLQAHPLNAQLYGEEAGDDLRASIAVHGILTPLLITREAVIISGHRRHAVALELGLATVPVTVSPLTDQLDIKEALIRANIARTKSNYQRAREYQQLKPIQAEMAKRRKVSGDGGDHSDNCPYGPKLKGRASDLTAEMLGMTGKTAERALRVVIAIDRASANGHQEHADFFITHLNKSVMSGYKSARALGYLKENHDQTSMTAIKHCTWAHWQWDPLTGCQGTCLYCSMRDQADRTPVEFIDRKATLDEQQRQLADPYAPRLHPLRLQAPIHTLVADGDKPAHYRVLTGWQGEMFGSWVPQEWIDQVLNTVRASAEKRLPWLYLFLTKHPDRLLEIDWPSNAWVGITVDSQERVQAAEDTLQALKQRYPALVTYLACEPLLEELRFNSLAMCNWLFIGGQARTASSPECPPQWHWVLSLMSQASRDGCGIAALPTLKPIFPMSGPDADENELPVHETILNAVAPLLHQVTI